MVAALIHVSGSLGSAAPWLLLLMVSDGQFGFGTMLALCLIGGALLGIGAVALRAGGRPPAAPAATRSGPPSEISAGSGMEGEQVGRPAEPLDARPITSLSVGDDLGIER